MKTLAKKLMALVLCLAMALGLLGVTSAGAVQSAPKAEESASKVIYATDSKTTYVPAGYTYVYQSTDGRIYTRKATQDTYISGRTSAQRRLRRWPRCPMARKAPSRQTTVRHWSAANMTRRKRRPIPMP